MNHEEIYNKIKSGEYTAKDINAMQSSMPHLEWNQLRLFLNDFRHERSENRISEILEQMKKLVEQVTKLNAQVYSLENNHIHTLDDQMKGVTSTVREMRTIMDKQGELIDKLMKKEHAR